MGMGCLRAKRLGLSVEPYWVRLRVEQLRTFQLEWVDIPILLPFELAHAILHISPTKFQTSFLGDNGGAALAEFWQWAETQTSWGRAHPALCSPQADLPRDRLLPVMWFVDGCEVHNASEHVVWSWSSFFGGGDIWDCKFLFASLPSRRMRSKSTQALVHSELCKIIGWQQAVWTSGVFPEVGHDGQPLSGERVKLANQRMLWRSAFIGLRTDSKARKECHNFHRWYGATYCCDLCLCTQPFPNADAALTMLDLSRDAEYARTMFSHEQYLAYERVRSPWCHVPGWRLECCYFDLLHVLHLGVCKQSNASCIAEMLESGCLPGDSVVDKLCRLTVQFGDWCKARRLPAVKFGFTATSIGRSTKTEFPELASYFKGCHVKLITHFMAEKVPGHACLVCSK
jgi:hypothetical protein